MRRAANSSVARLSASTGRAQRLRIRTRSLARQIGQRRLDRRALRRIEQLAIGRERIARRIGDPVGLDLRFGQRTLRCVVRRMRERVLQHPRDLVVGESVRRLHHDRRFHARRLLARGYGQQPVRIDLERHLDARSARDHRRNAAKLEARERAAVGDLLALALNDMDRHRRLAVLVRREFLRTRDRDRRVARDDLLAQASHRLEAERQAE